MPELDRRDFLKVVGLSAGAAASAACREPVEKVIPYLVQPEEVIPGIPTYYASTCRECPVACSTRVKTREGRPIKVDVNPDDPISSAGLCVRGQASLNRTYDDLRFRSPMQRQGDRLVAISWEEATRLLVEKLGPAGAAGKVTFVGGLETGTLDELIDEFLAKLGSPDRVRFELYAHEALRTANSQVFGIDGVPQFDIGHSDLVISFGADFLETWLNTPQNQQGFAESRRGGKGYAIYVGPRLGLTGANTDEWLAPEPGTEVFVALALAHELAGGASSELRGLLGPFSPDEVAGLTGVPAERLREVAERIRNAEAPLALPPGNEVQGTNAASFAAAVQILNYVAGAINQTVRFGPDQGPEGARGPHARRRGRRTAGAPGQPGLRHAGRVRCRRGDQAGPVRRELLERAGRDDEPGSPGAARQHALRVLGRCRAGQGRAPPAAADGATALRHDADG
jgi:molybdopterin-containing oxidoreductase family iron-sulfur binding subunit